MSIYGSPGFLAAYNAGPARLDDYLANIRPLPDETRHYVAMIGPNLRGVYPNNRSAADQMAMNVLPINIPPGQRYGRPVMLANARPVGGGRVPQRCRWRLLSFPSRRGMAGCGWSAGGAGHAAAAPSAAWRFSPDFHRPMPPMRRRPAANRPRRASGRSRSARSPIRARRTARCRRRSTMPMWNWRSRIPYVASVHQGHGVLWRARMTGMSRETAVQACEKITHGRSNCIVLSPEAQL